MGTITASSYLLHIGAMIAITVGTIILVNYIFRNYIMR